LTEVIEGEVLSTTQKNLTRKRKPSAKGKKFINEIIANGGDATAAAKAAFNVDKNAGQLGYIYKQKYADLIEAKMEKFGLNDDVVVMRHKDIIENGNDQVAMKAIDTYYRVRSKETADGTPQINITMHF